MHEICNMFLSADGKQAKENDMPVNWGKNKKEKSFFYSQNH